MTRYLVSYTHVEATTYKQWIEASSEEEALQKIKEEADFEKVTNVEGVEMKDFKILDAE